MTTIPKVNSPQLKKKAHFLTYHQLFPVVLKLFREPTLSVLSISKQCFHLILVCPAQETLLYFSSLCRVCVGVCLFGFNGLCVVSCSGVGVCTVYQQVGGSGVNEFPRKINPECSHNFSSSGNLSKPQLKYNTFLKNL